ncbi:hypothetical protein BDR22DRAFT_182480 [Usnea florida]
MIEPLNPRILSALLRDYDDDENKYVPMAKRCLNEHRNLSAGVSHLLDTYKAFQAHLWQHDIPCGHERGADSWHIEFLDPPFSNLRIYSTSFEGVIDVYVRNKPFLSIRIFDHPQNWQALLQWLWEYGDRCQIARSLLPLDPQKLSAIYTDSDTPSDASQAIRHAHTSIDAQGTDDTFHSTIGAARRALAKNGTGEGMYKLLLAFQNFNTSLHWDISSAWHADVGYEKWHISFSNSPFRSLRLHPGSPEGVVEIHAFQTFVQSFQMTGSSQNWQACLEWIWNYGNSRHIAKAEYEVSHPRKKNKNKPPSKQHRAQKPLLHQVLRTAGFKAQQGPILKAKALKDIPEEKQPVMMQWYDATSMSRRVLQLADPNGRVGKSGQTPDIAADPGAKAIR